MKIPMVAISAAIVVIVLAAVLMPVLGDATTTEDTFSNVTDKTIPFMKITNEDTYTMTWTESKPYVLTVNGEDITIWKTGDGNKNISIFEIPGVGIIRYNMGTNGTVQNTIYQIVGPTVQITAKANLTVSATNGAISIQSGTNTAYTTTADVVYGVGNGDFVLKQPTQDAYMTADSEYFGMGVTEVSAWNDGFQIEGTIEGTIENGPTVSLFAHAVDNVTVSDEAAVYSEVSGYVGLYKLSKVTFTATTTDESPSSVSATYNYFLVPTEVTAERAQHLAPNEIAILGAIPALIIVALLIGVLAIFMRSRAE